ncbi:glycosyltransferase family 2 protein [Bacillus sp. NPDC077027]|uniref:glycosyltransferase family 2 protein n=1 Tax=Bacillus sp. NPDC077027 TaxID=3390548 RepID=UPI003D0452A2
MPAISLLVAVYNTSQYVEKCLRSIAEQTFSEIEVILVNDGSTDHSADILEQFTKRDKRFRVIHQPNQGLGAVRNKGIEEAKGEYVAFIDSDDTLDPDYCMKLYERAMATDADVVVSDYFIQFEQSNRTLSTSMFGNQKVGNKERLIKDLLHGNITGFSWNKLYRRSFLEKYHIRFPLRDELENIEDQYVTLRCFYLANVIAFVHQPLYYYRVHVSSIVQRYQKHYFQHGLVLYQAQQDFLKKHHALKHFESALHFFLVNHGINCMLNEWKSHNKRPVQQKIAHIREISTNKAFTHAMKQIERTWLTERKRTVFFLAKYQLFYLLYVATAGYQKIIEYKTKK